MTVKYIGLIYQSSSEVDSTGIYCQSEMRFIMKKKPKNVTYGAPFVYVFQKNTETQKKCKYKLSDTYQDTIHIY